MVKLVSVERAKKHLKLKILVSQFVPGTTRRPTHETSRQPAIAIPHPRKQRRISLHKLLLPCFLGCGIARFLSLRPASRSVRIASRSVQVAWRSHRGLPPGPREQNLRPKFSILGVFWPFRPKRALPHPITIQNMGFGR